MAPDNKNIERITIGAHRPCDPSIVKRIEQWAVKWAIEAKDAMLAVILILIG
jgi:hypothetical protein